MARRFSRREVLRNAAGTSAALGAAAIIGAPAIVRAQQPVAIATGTLTGGWTHLTNDLLLERKFDQANGVKFSIFNSYSSVQQYYADMVAGNVQIGIGAWEAFARAYMQGAPIRLIGIVSTGSLAGLFSASDGPSSLAELKGKMLAAMQVSGTYQMARAWIKEFEGYDIEQAMNVQNAPNPPGTIALVSAKRADAALTWEHSLSTGLHRMPGSKVFFNLGDYYKARTNRDMPYFALAMRADVIAKLPPGSVAKAVKAYSDMFDWVHANEPTFADMAKRLEIEPAVIKTALESKRMYFKMQSIADVKNRDQVMFAAEILTKNGILPKKLDEGFFAA